jgi:hypothetical protein
MANNLKPGDRVSHTIGGVTYPGTVREVRPATTLYLKSATVVFDRVGSVKTIGVSKLKRIKG